AAARASRPTRSRCSSDEDRPDDAGASRAARLRRAPAGLAAVPAPRPALEPALAPALRRVRRVSVRGRRGRRAARGGLRDSGRGHAAGVAPAFLTEGEPDRLCAIQVLIEPAAQGRGLARPMLEHMRRPAREHGWELVAPVRPTWKERYRLAPIKSYARWRREDRLLF